MSEYVGLPGGDGPRAGAPLVAAAPPQPATATATATAQTPVASTSTARAPGRSARQRDARCTMLRQYI